jgi:hypothetical protein
VSGRGNEAKPFRQYLFDDDVSGRNSILDNCYVDQTAEYAVCETVGGDLSDIESD